MSSTKELFVEEDYLKNDSIQEFLLNAHKTLTTTQTKYFKFIDESEEIINKFSNKIKTLKETTEKMKDDCDIIYDCLMDITNIYMDGINNISKEHISEYIFEIENKLNKTTDKNYENLREILE